MRVEVMTSAFRPGVELDTFQMQLTARAGGVVSFTGIVRDEEQKSLMALELEHYPGMTERRLAEITQEATQRFELIDGLVLHRVGRIPLGAPIMMVATAAAHRQAAFDGAMFMMDYLKSRAPFWKKEHFAGGQSAWVAARQGDEEALTRW